MKNFNELGLSEKLSELLSKSGITEPSEIQEKVIPLILEGKDVIGGSATGSGKTLAFGSGIIERTEIKKGLQVLILVPTRELAEQVGNVFKKFSNYKRLNVAIVYGGVSITNQIRDLRNVEIVVGTPGRILDHMERRTINFSDLNVLVLDEADRMLDMGFINDVDRIIKSCPRERQTLLFSATISTDIDHLAKKYLKNPQSVSVESYVDPTKLKQIYYDTPKNLKFSFLVHLLKKEKHGLVMVFCNTRHNTDFIAKNLKNLGMEVLAIHGGLTQDKRNRIMEKFNDKKVYILVCTDIAARGLDIKGISHVYNYDIPKTSKDYIHRIGRTARAGKEGIAINIVSDRDYDNFRNVLSDRSLTIEKEEIPHSINRVGITTQGFERDRGVRGREWQKSGEWTTTNNYNKDEGDGKARPGYYGRSPRGYQGKNPRQSRYGGSESRGPTFGNRGPRGGSARRNIKQRGGNYRGGGSRFSGKSPGRSFQRSGGRR